MAKAPEKKPDASNAAVTRVLPMQLKQGDRLTDETGEWEIIGRAYTTNAGKDAHARIGKSVSPTSSRFGLGARTSVSA